jgi:hypothetical protein
MFKTGGPNNFERLKTAMQSGDPYLQHAAIMAAANPAYRQHAVEATRDTDSVVRLGAMLALQRASYPEAATLVGQMLSDPDVQVRQSALIWAGKADLIKVRSQIDRSLTAGPVTPQLFETYLETVSHLMPEFIHAYQNRSEAYSKTIKRSLPPKFIETFIADKGRPALLRAHAFKHLEQPAEHITLLTGMLAKETDDQL